MTGKFIHWIKKNGWKIVGILLAMNIIYVYFSDKYYFYNSENVRYTIAKYKNTSFLVGKSPKTQYDFSYEVNGNSYNTYTRATLSNYNLEEDRLLIKYSTKKNKILSHCDRILLKLMVYVNFSCFSRGPRIRL